MTEFKPVCQDGAGSGSSLFIFKMLKGFSVKQRFRNKVRFAPAKPPLCI